MTLKRFHAFNNMYQWDRFEINEAIERLFKNF